MITTHPSNLAEQTTAYARLQREMHDSLLAQHPEWILPNGDCPTCDSYDARFAELLNQTLPARRHESDEVDNFSMPAGYTEARNIIFPEMTLALQ